MNQYSKVNTSCLLILTFIAMAFTLSITKSILIPFTMAIFITFIYSPFIQYFHEKFKLPKNLVLGISLILFILGISLMAILLSKSIQTFLQGADQYKDRLSEVSIQVTQTLQNFGFGFSQNEVKELFQKVPLGKFIKDISGGLVGGISNSFLVIIFSLFLLTGDSMSKQKNKTYEEIKKNTRKYIQTKLMTSAATAIISYVILVSFGVEMAFMFAFLTFLLNFIPTVGSIVAVIIPLPIILLQFGFGVKLALILGLLLSVQTIIGNILEPKLMGESMGLHPVTILLFLTFWGFVWGVTGMFLSVPITATLNIVFSKFELTKPVSHLLAGKLQLT